MYSLLKVNIYHKKIGAHRVICPYELLLILQQTPIRYLGYSGITNLLFVLFRSANLKLGSISIDLIS
jgi:hypothetical protein